MKWIVLKELKEFFRSPSTYVMAAVFTMILGWIFFNLIVMFVETTQALPLENRSPYDFSNMVIIKFFGNVNFLMLIIAPILSFKSFSSEYINGTYDLYRISNLGEYKLVIAKYLSVCSQGLFFLACTVVFPLILGMISVNDYSYVLTGYLGLFLNFCCFASVGLFCSSIGKNQMLGMLLSVVSCVFLWMMNWLSQFSAEYIVTELIKYLSISSHFENLVRGVVSLSDIVFYLSFVFVLVVLTKKRLELGRRL